MTARSSASGSPGRATTQVIRSSARSASSWRADGSPTATIAWAGPGGRGPPQRQAAPPPARAGRPLLEEAADRRERRLVADEDRAVGVLRDERRRLRPDRPQLGAGRGSPRPCLGGPRLVVVRVQHEVEVELAVPDPSRRVVAPGPGRRRRPVDAVGELHREHGLDGTLGREQELDVVVEHRAREGRMPEPVPLERPELRPAERHPAHARSDVGRAQDRQTAQHEGMRGEPAVRHAGALTSRTAAGRGRGASSTRRSPRAATSTGTGTPDPSGTRGGRRTRGSCGAWPDRPSPR